MCIKYPYPNCPIAGNHRRDECDSPGFTEARHSRWWVPVSMDPRSHCDQCGKRPSHEHHSRLQSPGCTTHLTLDLDLDLDLYDLCSYFEDVQSMESWRMLTVWQYADSHHEILQGLVSSIPLDTNSCCFTACPGHWIPFLSVQAPRKSKNIIGKWQTTMSQSIDPLGFCRWKMKPPLASFVTRLNMGALQCFQQCKSMNLFVIAAQICHGHKRFVQLYSKCKASRRNWLLN